MKRNTLYTIGLAFIASLSLNSCAELMPETEANRQEDPQAHLSLTERKVIAYLESINIVNNICDNLSSGQITKSEALAYLRRFNADMSEIDPIFVYQCEDCWTVLNGPKYVEAYEMIKAKIFSQGDKFGVYLMPDDHDRNDEFQGVLMIAIGLATHSG